MSIRFGLRNRRPVTIDSRLDINLIDAVVYYLEHVHSVQIRKRAFQDLAMWWVHDVKEPKEGQQEKPSLRLAASNPDVARTEAQTPDLRIVSRTDAETSTSQADVRASEPDAPEAA